jgi:uncharacterized protein YbjT (DUF2867 family)
MTKLVVILGGTSKHGGSVVNAFLKDSSFRVRAVVRDVKATSAQNLLSRGVEVVEGDINNEDSLKSAFEISQSVCHPATTNFSLECQFYLRNDN